MIFPFRCNLKLRWKLLVVVLPLVIVPIFLVGGMVGYIATKQAYRGITQTARADLDHMAHFTLDLLNSHDQQFQAYEQDKRERLAADLKRLTAIAYRLVETADRQYRGGHADLAAARQEALKTLRLTGAGAGDALYVFDSKGDPIEGRGNIPDESGIREMVAKARNAPPGQPLSLTASQRDPAQRGIRARTTITVFRYFKDWDWVIAASSTFDDDPAFERRSFAELEESIKSKKVGKTGYIFCMTDKGTFTVHPDAEGRNFYDAKDFNGRRFIKEMCEKKNGWIRYPWKNIGDPAARMKIVRYVYFAPWHWIVAVGSYEDEFYQEANAIKGRTIEGVLFLTFVIGLLSVVLVFLAANLLTQPIHQMIDTIRKVKQGRLDQPMEIDSNDEFGELAAAFNRMTGIIQRNKEMESALAQQGKMASLGVLSSGVAHEINNPLGVILGYASYLEGKIPGDDPVHYYIHEIKRESKRCKKIVQDLLSYARTPKPTLVETDINALLGQIVEFAANHTDMRNVTVVRDFTPELPPIEVDGDQLRQVAINLILNAGAAMPEGGKLVIRTLADDEGYLDIVFSDNGSGIPAENVDKIFEPFFTTKARGTGLGLAITKQIIEQHQGKIVLVSKVGQGTTVTVRLPMHREEY